MVKTSTVRGAGTDANVFIKLFGQNGDSGDIHLKDSETFKDPFETDQLDVFTLKVRNDRCRLLIPLNK